MLHNFIYKYQSQKNTYNKKKLLAEKKNKEKYSKDNIETRADLAKKDEKNE